MGLVARALEMEGIATTLAAWHAGRIRLLSVPRALITGFGRGVVFGAAGDHAQQQRVLGAALKLLERDAPLKPVRITESLESESA